MNILEITKTFPEEERFSLTDQIGGSSRSVPANISLDNYDGVNRMSGRKIHQDEGE